jgi:hypothetical protein
MAMEDRSELILEHWFEMKLAPAPALSMALP